MSERPTYRAEIERLHAFFVAWFTGTAEDVAFEGFDGALDAEFEMVTPDGTRVLRAAVVDSVREAYGRDAPGTFDIDIRNVEVVQAMGAYATVRYEEWQETPEETTGRISTVLFREDSDAPGGLVWVDLHETWLDG